MNGDLIQLPSHKNKSKSGLGGPPQEAERVWSLVSSRSRSFTLALASLPRHQRLALAAVYLWMQQADDIVDAGGADLSYAHKNQQLSALVDQTLKALDGANHSLGDLGIALQWASREHQLPSHWFLRAATAIGRDLEPTEFKSWEDLYAYCDGVAGVPGWFCLRVFGASEVEKSVDALNLGRAMQLVNVLRDLRVDLGLQRSYVPSAVLANVGVASVSELLQSPVALERFRSLWIEKVQELWAHAPRLEAMVHKECRFALRLIQESYSLLLKRIENAPIHKLYAEAEPIRLSVFDKTTLWCRARIASVKAALAWEP